MVVNYLYSYFVESLNLWYINGANEGNLLSAVIFILSGFIGNHYFLCNVYGNIKVNLCVLISLGISQLFVVIGKLKISLLNLSLKKLH